VRVVATMAGSGTIFDECQSVKRERMEYEVRPLQQPSIAFETDRSASIGFTGERAQRAVELRRLHTAIDADGSNVMAVKPFGQPAQHWLTGVGRDAIDDQLAAGDTERDHRAVLKQPASPAYDRVDNGAKRGMSARIHRVSMKRDVQLDEKLTQLTRQNTAL
jgi:hypothetical protein